MKSDILNHFDLNGKVAAITAGGGDLCGAMAEALGAMGVKVAVIDIDVKKAEARSSAVTGSGGTAKAFRCDVLDRAQVRECYEAVCSLWGPPDFLINGAGGNAPRATTSEEFQSPAGSTDPSTQSFFDLDPIGFRQVFDLNFMGTFLVSQVFSRGMVDRGKGSIVNISSMSALTPLTKVPAYSAAKGAVSNFTQWLAVHFSRTGVRVNALAPGFFASEMTDELPPGYIDKVVALSPAGRIGDPAELGAALVFLASPAAGYITGQVLSVDGGLTIV